MAVNFGPPQSGLVQPKITLKCSFTYFLVDYCLSVETFAYLKLRPEPHSKFVRCNKNREVEVL